MSDDERNDYGFDDVDS
jgi:DNA-directed RNA polymerase I, II, and III subunit RPABC2